MTSSSVEVTHDQHRRVHRHRYAAWVAGALVATFLIGLFVSWLRYVDGDSDTAEDTVRTILREDFAQRNVVGATITDVSCAEPVGSEFQCVVWVTLNENHARITGTLQCDSPTSQENCAWRLNSAGT